jgi:hypothetical protein
MAVWPISMHQILLISNTSTHGLCFDLSNLKHDHDKTIKEAKAPSQEDHPIKTEYFRQHDLDTIQSDRKANQVCNHHQINVKDSARGA